MFLSIKGRMGSIKTNAIRLLDAKKIKYKLIEYQLPEGFTDGVSVAKITGTPVEKVFKTLVTTTGSEFFVCVVPVAEELDLKKAAKHFGVKKIEMLHMKDLLKTTGYVHGGCSPIGMKKLFKTVVDKSALDLPAIVVSGGKIGLQLELQLADLLKMTNGTIDDITVD